MSDAQSPTEARLAALGQALATHARTLEQGKPVDLTGLDKEIGEICLELFNARPDSARFLPTLQALMAQLDQLSTALARQHGLVS